MKKKAFTIIELMLLVAVLTLLLSLAFARVYSFQQGRGEKKIVSVLRHLQYSIEAYRIAHGGNTYPPDLTFLGGRQTHWLSFSSLIPGQLSVDSLGYRFTYLPKAPGKNGRIEGFDLSAAPLNGFSTTLQQAFVTGEGGTVYLDNGQRFGRVDPGDKALF